MGIGGVGAAPPPAADCSGRSFRWRPRFTGREVIEGVATGMELGRGDAGVPEGFVLRLGGGLNVAVMSGGDGSWY